MRQLRPALSIALAVGILSSSCSRPVDYVRPVRWSYIRLPPSPAGAKEPAAALKAARYQLQICENIANAYSQRAESRGTWARVLGFVGPTVVAGGAAVTAVTPLLNEDSLARRNLAITGIVLSLIGAGAAVGNAYNSAERAEAYTRAAGRVSGATEVFRSSLRDVALHANPEAMKERICTLRSACFQKHLRLEGVGAPFDPKTEEMDAFVLAESEEAPLVNEFITAMCSHPGGATPAQLDSCLASDAPQTAPCTEVVCEAGLNGNHPEARARCAQWAHERTSDGAPNPTDPAQVQHETR